MTGALKSWLVACSILLSGAAHGQNSATPTPWNYDEYRKAYPEQVARICTSQSGKKELESVLAFRVADQPRAETGVPLREQLRAAWRDLLGPPMRNTGPLAMRVLEEQEFPKFVRRKVEYVGDPDEPIRAWLFIPKGAKAKQTPAMLCLHQTVRSGKDQCAGVAELKPELAYGPLLAERGYVTICPDAICFGERYQVGGSFYCHYGDAVRLYRAKPGRSIMSKMIDDAMRAVDALVSLPEVDPARIGSIGHSHGGYGTLFAMAFDERIKAGVVSCGFTCFRADHFPDRWYRRTALIPRLGQFEGQMENSPVDFHHLFGAIAPRPLFLSVALKDSIFPQVGDMKWIERDLQQVYQGENAGQNFECFVFDGEHAFTDQARDRAWAFLDRHFQPAARASPEPKSSADFPLKQRSAFFTTETLTRIRANVANNPWARQLRDQIVANAKPWMALTDDALWELMFGATLPRSWMVWSSGHCPACQKSVEMYRWKMDAWNHPWKVRCPECQELFPKNDFEAFYRSGLDRHGVFDPKLANRDLLFNVEHPDPNDPRRSFGVDDGTGYVEGEKRWRFIAAYLIFGQFHQKVLAGIDTLAAAYVLTGETTYARKAGVLLDRVADLYPAFDFATQGYVYEKNGIHGYVSVWHDTSEETYEMVLAYDQIFEALREDAAFVEFLSSKARAYQLKNPKSSFGEIQRNIERGILRDALAHPEKIHSNFPRRECTEAAIHTVLGWPENRSQVEQLIDQLVAKATAVDGVTGEKGLAGYSAYTIAAMARFLNEYIRADPDFLSGLIQRHPSLRQTYRFHIETHCLEKYYPLLGDTGSFGQPFRQNPIMLHARFSSHAPLRWPLAPSMFAFFWQLYRQTGDVAYVQTIYRENGHSVRDLPYDVFEPNPAQVQMSVADLIAKHGTELKVGSINKQQWHLALLRSGRGQHARVVTLDYDSGGAHGHFDGMALGLFAHGLDLLPDFGYPPVQYGGWTTPRANWYKMTGAHNTVAVDGRNQATAAGRTTLWGEGESLRAVRVSGPELIRGKQYERTVAMVDVSSEDFYVVDVFRVVGGTNHAKFVYGTFADLETEGLSLRPAASPFGADFQLDKFSVDPVPAMGWSVIWNVQDPQKLLEPGARVRMRLTDLSLGVEAILAKSWIAPAYYQVEAGEVWNPCVISKRSGTAPLASTFVSLLEAFSDQPLLRGARRLDLRNSAGVKMADAQVGVAIQLKNGMTDVLMLADAENPLRTESAPVDGWLMAPELGIRLKGELGFVRLGADGRPLRAAIGRGSELRITHAEVSLPESVEFAEFEFNSGRPVRVRLR